jgi:HEAT repeat protein
MVLGLVAAGALIALFYWSAIWRGEPRYKGRTLTHWLAVYQKVQVNSPAERETVEAIRGIGTNALPYLLARLTYQTPAWRLKVVDLAGNVPGPAEDWATSLLLEEDHLTEADAGFTLLGAQAAPAVPELIQMLSDKDTWNAATLALTDIGEAAIPGLVTALTNRANAFQIRVGAAKVLSSGAGTSIIVPALASCLDDAPQIAYQAAIGLGRLRVEPTITVPALMKAAGNGLPLVRHDAISALGLFGTNALPAVSVLTNFLADPDPDIREATTSALETIAPETLGTNAEVISNQ